MIKRLTAIMSIAMIFSLSTISCGSSSSSSGNGSNDYQDEMSSNSNEDMDQYGERIVFHSPDEVRWFLGGKTFTDDEGNRLRFMINGNETEFNGRPFSNYVEVNDFGQGEEGEGVAIITLQSYTGGQATLKFIGRTKDAGLVDLQSGVIYSWHE